MNELVCDICGKAGSRIRHVSRSYGTGKDLLVIENVPVISCPYCGESYLTAEMLHELERIKLHRKFVGRNSVAYCAVRRLPLIRRITLRSAPLMRPTVCDSKFGSKPV